jgi:hypothetical protein
VYGPTILLRGPLLVTIEDPGEKYQYLRVNEDGAEFLVWKICRVKIFDPFWVTEPIPEDWKSKKILFPSHVPAELWKQLNEEEKLSSVLAEIRFDLARSQAKVTKLIAILVLFGILLLTIFARYLGLF